MSSIFRADDNYVVKPKRNPFDMSFQNNLSLKFGELVPVMCQPVVPGDSVKIDPVFGLRYMPQVFPVQTRQRASIKYYYVRNRNLWKDWPDFIGRTKQGLTPPYINWSAATPIVHLRPGSLADHLGVPIKIKVPAGSNIQMKLGKLGVLKGYDITYIPNSDSTITNLNDEVYSIYTSSNISTLFVVPDEVQDGDIYPLSLLYGGVPGVSDDIIPVPGSYPDVLRWQGTVYKHVYFTHFRKSWKVDFPFKVVGSGTFYVICRTTSGMEVAIRSTYLGGGQGIVNVEESSVYVRPLIGADTQKYEISSIIGVMFPSDSSDVEWIPSYNNATEFRVTVSANNGLCWCDVALDEMPFMSNQNPQGVRIVSLPFRAVESIYNALIRNAENNPFLIDGVPEYNKYLRSTEGGEETNVWDLLSTKLCNWADDRFTTALPSPQQGNAPLVGLTGVNGATVVLGNEDGTQSTVNLEVDADTGNVVMVTGVSSNSPDYLNDAMMSAVDFGITINDLRNVNSFQRWLENNIRRGYKYKDQLMSHYGVNARFDVLDMPEFIGGVTRDVNVEQVTQSATTSEAILGEYGGNSYVMGEGHSIEHYCDEHGFIIGLMCIYPMPIYDDTLPKYLIQHDAFDYYFPEFSKIGMQPITNKELAFSQSFFADDMDGTFGYQRAWYDYVENLDQVHGQFRFDLKNFLIGRDFANLPKLNPDFLTVSHQDLNNTFYSDDNEDKIIGQIYTKMSMKRPVPVVGISAIE